MILEHFIKLGFNLTEARLYLALAESGKISAGLLSKKTKIPRTTVYSVLENLKVKGLVKVEKKGNVTSFAPNKPNVLLKLLSDEKKQIDDKEQITKELIDEILPYFKSQNFSIPKIQFYESKNGIESMLYELSDEWQESIWKYDGIWWGFQDHSFVEQYRGWLDWYWNRMKVNEKINLLSNKVELEKTLKGKIRGREIRAISKSFNFTSTIWVLGDYIVVIMTGHEPQYSYQLHDSLLASNLRMVFRMLWGNVG
ncbi:MAG: hypothetical protein KBC84_04630 [Proteobacteria bacterium]|nr:hypothetical protein [Pseudomonadota bacterium]